MHIVKYNLGKIFGKSLRVRRKTVYTRYPPLLLLFLNDIPEYAAEFGERVPRPAARRRARETLPKNAKILQTRSRFAKSAIYKQ